MNIKITLSSVLMAAICGGLLTGLLYRIRNKKGLIKGYGIYGIVLLYLFCIVRILLPLDFPFTYGISVGGIFSYFYDIVWFDRYSVGRYELPLLAFLVLIWFGVALVKLIRFGLNHRRICRMIALLDVRDDVQCRAMLRKVFETAGKVRKVEVLYNHGITMPMSMGIRNWKIILPDRKYTDEELYYILLHEYMHLLNGDLKVKMLTCIFVCIFWWNPAVYLLEKDLECSLEMKCDLCVTEKLSREEVAAYLQTIVTAIQSCAKQGNFHTVNEAVSLGDGGKSEILQRFEFVLNNQKSSRGSKWNMAMLTAVFGLVWLASYSVIWIPSYEAPIEEIIEGEGCFELSPDFAHVIMKNGKYYLHEELETGEIVVEEISEEFRNILEAEGYEIQEE